MQFILPNLGYYLSRGQTSGDTNIAVLIKRSAEDILRHPCMAQILCMVIYVLVKVVVDGVTNIYYTVIVTYKTLIIW